MQSRRSYPRPFPHCEEACYERLADHLRPPEKIDERFHRFGGSFVILTLICMKLPAFRKRALIENTKRYDFVVAAAATRALTLREAEGMGAPPKAGAKSPYHQVLHPEEACSAVPVLT